MSTPSRSAAENFELSTIEQAQLLGIIGTNALSVPIPFESKIVLYESVRIAGTTHAPNIDSTVLEMPKSAKLTLVREPDNQADQWAIRIEYNGKKIGYLPADKNEIVARLMDGGKAVHGLLTETELQGNWWKVYMEVNLID